MLSRMDENKTELAEDRTDLAEDRTALANERTFAGWMRTAYAAVGIGLGFNALFGKMEPAWVPKTIATSLLIIAVFIFVAAERRASAIIHRLVTHEVVTVKVSTLRLLTILSVLATVSLAAAIWTLRITPG